MQKRIILAISLLLLFSVKSIAQKNPIPNPIITADSLATGNFKDVLNSFFQLTFDKLTGKDKEVKFSLNPFAVMAKLDTTLLVDTVYKRYRTLRNLNFTVAAALDTAYKFNGFSSGVKFAVINRRDETVSDIFVKTVLNNDSVNQLFKLNNMGAMLISKYRLNPQKGMDFALDWEKFTDGKISFNELNGEMRDSVLAIVDSLTKAGDDTARIVGKLLADYPDFNIYKRANKLYEEMKENFNKNLLWTIGLSDTTYKDEFMFSNLVFTSELLLGINKYKKGRNDLELNIRTDFQIVDDTLLADRDLKRMVFGFEPGINLVLKTKTTEKSFLEFKLSGSYYHTFSDLYPGEVRNRLTLNSTLRIRILNDIWVPIEIKYDPENGNFLGFLNVRANFKALGDAAKSLF
jgi:hypothetical protein